jgi:N-acetylglucosamine-6-phosphate deacetylase
MREPGTPAFTGRSVFSGRAVTVYPGEEYRVEAAAESASLPFISPGFFDMQVNGFEGVDYSLESLEIGDIERLIYRLAAAGVTRHIATFVSMPPARLLRNLALSARAMENPLTGGGIAGFHLEGPFISPLDGPRGAHDKNCLLPPDIGLWREWQEAARGHIKLVTLAPELPGALELISALAGEGVRVSIGHTAASPELIRAAVEAGASCSTHLGNGSHPMVPRLKNYIWEQMAEDSLMAGIICDGFHLPQAVVKAIFRTKQKERLILVSDAARFGGCAPGLYHWGAVGVEVFEDGHLGLPGSSALAGAAHLLDWDIPRFMEYTGTSLGEALALCTVQPARYLGLPSEAGFEPAGGLTLFFYTPGRGRLEIETTFSGGRVIYQRQGEGPVRG